jgi:lipoic acid synthetase
VDRDDVPDGGADAFAQVVEAITAATADVIIEVLMPDFSGSHSALDRMAATKAEVFGHNLETVRRLTPGLRDRRAGYDQSLDVLRYLTEVSGGRTVKSGLMVGLGESLDEIREAMADLRAAGVTMLTLGQYLQPSMAAVPVARFVSPEEFAILEAHARDLGFRAVVAGPLVRSSYHAAAAYNET